MEENKKFFISYSKELQDIAHNTLSVKITEQLYDPIAEQLVKQFAEKAEGVSVASYACNRDVGQPIRPVILQEVPDYLPKIEEPKKAVLTLIPPTCKL
jgi:hypothetical protein